MRHCLVGPKSERPHPAVVKAKSPSMKLAMAGLDMTRCFFKCIPGSGMAELSPAEKNSISHRGDAFRQLPALLKQLGLLND